MPVTNMDKPVHDYLQPLIALFEHHADPETAGPMANYMRDQFSFLGIKSPQRKALFKEFLAQYGLPQPQDLAPIVLDLWQLPQREYQYTAQDLWHRLRKQITPEAVRHFVAHTPLAALSRREALKWLQAEGRR